MRLMLLICCLLLAIPLAGALAQDDISLSPFIDESYGIQGLLPDGWTKSSAGLYQRRGNAADITLVAMQSAPLTPDDLFAALLPQFGLSEVPESIGTSEGAFLDWTLYQFDVSAGNMTVSIDLGLANVDDTTYLVLLQTTPEEYPALHEGVFNPLINALQLYSPPQEDLPYLAENIYFRNEDVMLGGTITLPEAEGTFPAIVLISGSGKQDRDESLLPIAEIKPFRLIADHLTRAGYIVLRYDDRGFGESTGELDSTLQENASDAASAIAYLKTRPEVNPDQIGVLGHSEGGTIAALLGATNPDVAFIISMAGTAVDGKDVLYIQNERLLAAEGATPEQVAAQLAFLDAFFPALESNDSAAIRKAIEDQIRNQAALLTEEELAAFGDIEIHITIQVEATAQQYDNRWFRSFVEYDPSLDWAQVTQPVLAIFGDLDVQVDAEQNATALEAALQSAENPHYEIIRLPDANHLFQSAVSGGLSEYSTLEQTFTPEFLPTITAWLDALFAE